MLVWTTEEIVKQVAGVKLPQSLIETDNAELNTSFDELHNQIFFYLSLLNLLLSMLCPVSEGS